MFMLSTDDCLYVYGRGELPGDWVPDTDKGPQSAWLVKSTEPKTLRSVAISYRGYRDLKILQFLPFRAKIPEACDIKSFRNSSYAGFIHSLG